MHLSQVAWDRIKNISIDGTPVSKFVATVFGDVLQTDTYDPENSVLTIEAFGSNESSTQWAIIQLLAAAKDLPGIDAVAFENREEFDVGMYLIWKGGWVYRTPTYRRPSLREQLRIEAKTDLRNKTLTEVLREYLPDNSIIDAPASVPDVVESVHSTRVVERGRLVKGKR